MLRLTKRLVYLCLTRLQSSYVMPLVTNIITQFGALLTVHAITGLLSLLPFAGSALAAAAEGAVGYCLIYAASNIYIKLISRVVKPDGSIDVSDANSTKHILSEKYCNGKT